MRKPVYINPRETIPMAVLWGLSKRRVQVAEDVYPERPGAGRIRSLLLYDYARVGVGALWCRPSEHCHFSILVLAGPFAHETARIHTCA